MQTLRKSEERGHADHGWLNARHSFSFADYFDPSHMGFRALRVINEDRIAANQGFDTHPHKDMEIITYVMEGELEHKDSMGNGSVIRAGDIQYMSAGSGVRHSEFNPSKTAAIHLLQIWILPEKKNLEPRYSQKNIGRSEKLNTLKLLASHDGKEDSIAIRQDVSLYASVLEPTKSLEFNVAKNRYAWIQVIRGKLDVNGTTLSSGDALALDTQPLKMQSLDSEAEFLLFDLN